jgi:acyl-coenzyme A synthetase/AMP-(fatty) acid ligase
MDAYPLVSHQEPGEVVAWRHGRPITAAQFLADVERLCAAWPAGHHVLNACSDRYRFAVGLAAALLSGKVSLLPPSHTAETVRQMKAYEGAFCLVDGPATMDMPRHLFDELAPEGAQARPVPMIPADRTLALVFTSGSTGVPVPHRKTWGRVVLDVRAEAAALLLPHQEAVAVVATVPPQHMYGIESTVLLPLQSGGALCAGHPFYPADIAAALNEVPGPRMLVTTPLHLRNLLDSQVPLPPVRLVLSATAPLSPELARRAEARLGAPLQEIYGSTETGQIATRLSTRTSEWTLLPGIELAEREGRFWASGGHVGEPTPLGDLLELTAPGRFLLQGRLGDMVNIAGKRNSLAYLNHQLLAIPGVQDGVFFMPGDEARDGVTRLAAFAVAPGMSVTELRDALRARIEAIFLPRPLVLLASLPRNSTGKLTRETIEALAREHLQPGLGQGETSDGN